ncbi:MAG: TonB-dependent receptor, partial [Vicinamibacteria bacterium]
MRFHSRAFAALVCWALHSPSFSAAASTFELSGTVLDESGLGLAGATLTLVHQSTGHIRTATSGDTGYYSFPALAPGVYSLEARLSGYASSRFAGLRYFADTKPIFNITLSPRDVQESMTFTGEAPLVNVSQSQVGLSVEERQLEELPLSRRDYLELVTLEGAARELPEGPPGEPPFGAPRHSVNGASAYYTAYLLDGFQNTRDQHGVVHTDASLEVIEEFRIVTGQFSAEYGRSLASIVSASTRAGGNDWHGSLFTFIRPGGWDASDPLTSENTSLDRQDVGFTLGGPLIREKTHLFAGVEYRSQDEKVVVTAPFESGRFRGLYELPSDRLQVLLKLSHVFDTRHQLAVKGVFSREDSVEGAGGYDIFENAFDIENDDASFSATLISEIGTALSELRVGFSSESFAAIAGPPPLGAAIRDPLQGNIGSATRLERADEDHFELAEVLSLPRGTHGLKTGFSFLRIGSTSELLRYQDGVIFVPAVAGAPTLGFRSEGTASALERDESHIQLFVQDDWQFSPFVTFNLGLRWEKETSVGDNDNFAPRLGFHWDATRDGRTSVRGGYGVFYSAVVSIVDTLERLYGPSGLGVVAGTGEEAAARASNFYVAAPEYAEGER